MNKENILLLADRIERGTIRDWDRKTVHFNMSFWNCINVPNYKGRKCGTVACIGGSAEILFNKNSFEWVDSANALGLTYEQSQKLFYPYAAIHDDDWDRITPAAAAEVLRHLAKTGHIRWKRAIKLHPLMPEKRAA